MEFSGCKCTGVLVAKKTAAQGVTDSLQDGV
jgi:hypothetical protein